ENASHDAKLEEGSQSAARFRRRELADEYGADHGTQTDAEAGSETRDNELRKRADDGGGDSGNQEQPCAGEKCGSSSETIRQLACRQRPGDTSQQCARHCQAFLGRRERKVQREILRRSVYDRGVITEQQSAYTPDKRNTNQACLPLCQANSPMPYVPFAVIDRAMFPSKNVRLSFDHLGRAGIIDNRAPKIAGGIDAIIVTGPRRIHTYITERRGAGIGRAVAGMARHIHGAAWTQWEHSALAGRFIFEKHDATSG